MKFNIHGGEGSGVFQVWVPLEWTALGFVMCVRHFIQRQGLMDDIPPIPSITNMELRTCQTETTVHEVIRRLREGGGLGSRWSVDD